MNKLETFKRLLGEKAAPEHTAKDESRLFNYNEIKIESDVCADPSKNMHIKSLLSYHSGASSESLDHEGWMGVGF
jgi:hypothetical protein